MKRSKAQLRVITGNAAAAYAATLCSPDVVTSYPITPMSEVAEQLSTFHANGICQPGFGNSIEKMMTAL